MGKIISQLNVTPDGFCNHTDVIADDELHEFASDLLRKAELTLFGRVTYQLMESYWPMAAKDRSLPDAIFEFANLINDAEKIVFSRTLKTVEWKKTRILAQLDRDEIVKLKKDTTKAILTGSPGIISQLSKLGLVDEYYFLVQPVIAGKGKRLFEITHLERGQNMKLIESIGFKSGVMALHYQTINR